MPRAGYRLCDIRAAFQKSAGAIYTQIYYIPVGRRPVGFSENTQEMPLGIMGYPRKLGDGNIFGKMIFDIRSRLCDI